MAGLAFMLVSVGVRLKVRGRIVIRDMIRVSSEARLTKSFNSVMQSEGNLRKYYSCFVC